MTRKYNTRANKNRQTNKHNTHTHTSATSSNTITHQTLSQNWHKLVPPPDYTPQSYTHPTPVTSQQMHITTPQNTFSHTPNLTANTPIFTTQPPNYTPQSYTHPTHVTSQQMHVTTPQNTFTHTPILTANTPIFTAQPPNYTTHTSILANTPIFTAQPPNYATHTPIYTTNTPILTQTLQNTIDRADERQFLENMEIALQYTAEKAGLNINAREFLPAEYVPTPTPSPTPTYASQGQGRGIDRQYPATPVQQLPQLPPATAAGQGHGGVIRYHQRSHQGLSTPAPSHPSSGPAGGLHEVAWQPVIPGPAPTTLLPISNNQPVTLHEVAWKPVTPGPAPPPTEDSRGQLHMDSNNIDPFLYYNMVLTVPIAINKHTFAVSMKFP